VLDWGFWARFSRDEARDFARDNKAEAVFYHIMCDEAVALARTLQRTESKEEGSVFIDEPAFYSLKARYEAPDDDEGMIVVDMTSS
jgi:gluconate kinase